MSAPREKRMVVVAQFAGPHGVRGDFKLRSFTEDPKMIFAYGPLAPKDGPAFQPRKLREMKPGVFLCRAEGFHTPEAWSAFKGQLLSVPRERLPQTGGDDDFYIEDIIGLDARVEDGTSIGTVRAVPNYGAGDILEIKGRDGLILVPFTKESVPDVDVASGFLTIVPPEDDGA